MGWFLKLSMFTILIHINVAVRLIPKELMTQTGASYTVMLVNDDETIKPKKCYLASTNMPKFYEIDLKTSGVPLKPINESFRPINTGLSLLEENTNFMTSLGYGICGFKLENVGKNYVPRWNISIIDENETLYYKDFYVLLKDIKYENKTQYVTIGNSFNVPCQGSNSQLQYLLDCKLYDPQGTLVFSGDAKRGCFYSVLRSKMSDYGVWKCVIQLKNNMSSRKVYYNIVEKGNVHTNVWQNETDTHVILGCSINNLDTFNDNSFCEMTRPDGEIFSLKEGLATDRYTTLGTNISKSICGMEIKKPLEEFEKGLWRCEFNYVLFRNNWYPIGGFINLSNETLPAPEIPKTILTCKGESFSISCRVPYSSSYCYMKRPGINGTIYQVEDNLNPSIGLCKFTKESANMADNGIWFCGFAQKTGQADSLYEFQVVVMENYGVKPENKDVESTRGSTVYLKCSTQDLGDYPVQYCRFKHPKGQMYNIIPGENSTNRMSYYGRGFNYGDCGVEIKSISLSDSGPWNCITRIGNNFDYPEAYSQINLLIK